MEPNIVTRGEFKVVGLRYEGKNQSGEIRQMWGEFMPRAAEIEHCVDPDVFYGVCSDAKDTGEFAYTAGREVSSLSDIPDGMVALTVPAAKYAVFTHKGKLETLAQTYELIYKTWLPESGYEATGELDFECYDERFNYGAEDSILDIYVAIK